MNPAPTPAPLNDIVGPVWVLPYPLWMILTAAVLALVLIGLVAWGLRRLLTRTKPPTARQKALAALESLRAQMAATEPYAFGILVSDAIRRYINEQHGLAATTQTSLEFLEAIRDNPVFSANEKAGLSVFLENTDLLKYARTDAGESERISLLETAGRLVRGEVQPGQQKGGAA